VDTWTWMWMSGMMCASLRFISFLKIFLYFGVSNTIIPLAMLRLIDMSNAWSNEGFR
jgi:hypothetical protein